MAHDGLAVFTWGTRVAGEADVTAAYPPTRTVLHPETDGTSSCEGLADGLPGVPLGVTAAAAPGTFDEAVVGMPGWQSCLEHAAYPAPLHPR